MKKYFKAALKALWPLMPLKPLMQPLKVVNGCYPVSWNIHSHNTFDYRNCIP